ncbi:hypothetical protein EJB05_18954, partial [Eragrostis curvula]
ALEGGPLIHCNGSFVGMNMFLVMEKSFFLPWSKVINEVNHFWTTQPMLKEKHIIFPERLKAARSGERPTSDITNCRVDEIFGDTYGKGIWMEFSKTVSSNISRGVVALASFNGDFTIEVLLPNKQRVKGILQHYSLHYNIALVGVDYRAHRPANVEPRCYSYSIVGAVGCCFDSGTLMAAKGLLNDWSGTLDCKLLVYSSCKITKAGIGGPLVSLDGKFLGMNFYDKKRGTPSMLWKHIAKVLAHFKEKGKSAVADGGNNFCKVVDTEGDCIRPNRWPVPNPGEDESGGESDSDVGKLSMTKRCGDDLTRSSNENKRGCCGGEEATESLISGDICWENTCAWSEHKNEVEDIAFGLSRTVVSLALSDGHTVLFACSGIAFESVGNKRFLTSASLVRASKEIGKYHDDLKIEVHYRGKVLKGYLQDYDLDYDIALVNIRTSVDALRAHINDDAIFLPGSKVVAVGRDISGKIMASSGILIGNISKSGCSSESGSSSISGNSGESEDSEELTVSTCKISQAWEGGALVDFNGNFVGMNLFMVPGEGTVFLPLALILERIEYFRTSLLRKKFFERLMNLKAIRVVGSSTCDMSSPEVVLTDNWELDSMGYPKPPTSHGVWRGLSNTVSETIRRNVVALASFNGEKRYFACTGFFIEWGVGYATILTSASLIEVLLPCDEERREGNLLHYNLHYNVALVSIKNFRVSHPVMFGHDLLDCSRDNVLAIGCCFTSGTLMAANGALIYQSGKLDCKLLAYSTCKITMAGIGGPVVDIKGNFIGMNFYDTIVGTPHLPWNEIVKILAYFKGKRTFAEVGDDASYAGPFWTIDSDTSSHPNGWPVPEPYWSDRDDLEEWHSDSWLFMEETESLLPASAASEHRAD